MIVGTGIDIVEIGRCAHWINFADVQLAKIFHPHEINQLRSKNRSDQPAFIASRFAVKEAFFKAYSGWWADRHATHPQSLWRVAPQCAVMHHTHGTPYLWVEPSLWQGFDTPALHISLSHERSYAIAQVIIEYP